MKFFIGYFVLANVVSAGFNPSGFGCSVRNALDAVRCTLYHHGDHHGFDHGLEELINDGLDVLSGIHSYEYVHGKFANRTVKGYSEARSPVHFLKHFTQLLGRLMHLEQMIRHTEDCQHRVRRGLLADIYSLVAGENPVTKTVAYLPQVIEGIYKGDLNPLAGEPESVYVSKTENRNVADNIADLVNTASVLLEKGGVSPGHIAKHIPSLIQSVGHGML